MAFIFEHERKGILYKGHYIQTYSFGTGENIVFSFPSFPHSGIYYLWFLNHYKNHQVKFITFDLPGWIGYSEDFLKDDFKIDEFINIAKEILKDYKVQDFNIIGYSFGGALGIRLASEMKDRVKKVVIVSTIINGLILKNNSVRLVKLAKKLKVYFAVMKVIKDNYYKITKALLKTDLSPDTLKLYSDMVLHLNARVITESIYQLFSVDWTKYLLDIKDKKILVISSKDEDLMFKQQAEYIRRHLDGENSYYISGTHDDFILRPQKDTVHKVLKFLIT